MKADASGWFSGVTGGSAPGSAGANGARSAEASEQAPAFDRLLRRTSPSARPERASGGEKNDRDTASTRERPSSASAEASRARTRDRRPDAPDHGVETTANDSATIATQAEHEPRQATRKDSDATAPWPPAGLILPMIPLPPDTVDGMSAAAPALDAGTGASLPPPAIATGLRTIGNGASLIGIALPGEDSPGDAPMQAGATTTDARPFGDIAATAGRPGEPVAASTTPAANQPAAALPLAGLAAASEPPPPALVAGLTALKEMVADAGARDTDAPTPLTAPLTGAAAPLSDHGLARTATVNPLTAMTPDLRGDRFGDTLGTQMTWMAEQKIGHAHIRVSPGDLGAIEVSLRLDGDRVHADFSSAQPEVRQALQDSLPKLREMLGQQGFQLAQADVGHRQQSSSQSSTPSPSSAGGRSDGGAAESGQGVVTTTVRTLRGLLDAYA